jgi:hypothetical protein
MYEYILVVSCPPFLMDDLSQPFGHKGHQLLQIIVIPQLQPPKHHYLSLSCSWQWSPSASPSSRTRCFLKDSNLDCFMTECEAAFMVQK